MGRVEIDDCRGILVSRFSETQDDYMESELLRLNLACCSARTQLLSTLCGTNDPAASNMPAELSCLNRAHPLGCDTLMKGVPSPFCITLQASSERAMQKGFPWTLSPENKTLLTKLEEGKTI